MRKMYSVIPKSFKMKYWVVEQVMSMNVPLCSLSSTNGYLVIVFDYRLV